MEKVNGIGGFFFRARDPKSLGRWYLTHLGIALTPESYDVDTDYFGRQTSLDDQLPGPESRRHDGAIDRRRHCHEGRSGGVPQRTLRPDS